MSDSKTPLRSQENSHAPESDEVLQIDASEDAADLGTDLVEGKVAEVAKDRISENKSDASGKNKGAAQTVASKQKEVELTDRMALREQLLKLAPQEGHMRAQVVRKLEAKKIKLEKDIRGYDRRQEYDLLTSAILQLRAVVRQLEIVAKAGYDALQEIWLKVVKKFA